MVTASADAVSVALAVVGTAVTVQAAVTDTYYWCMHDIGYYRCSQDRQHNSYREQS